MYEALGQISDIEKRRRKRWEGKGTEGKTGQAKGKKEKIGQVRGKEGKKRGGTAVRVAPWLKCLLYKQNS